MYWRTARRVPSRADRARVLPRTYNQRPACYPLHMPDRSRTAHSRRVRAAGRRAAGPRRAAMVAALAVLGAAGVTASFVFWPSAGGDHTLRATIVDQLSLTFPNEQFVEDATAKLEAAGYEVDYVPGEDVTVNFYRRLPDRDYDVILFRSHADRLQAETKDGEQVDEVILFTSEAYSTERYGSDQAANNVVIARYRDGGDPYFGIGAGFIDGGSGYDDATIIMMGCEGLLSERTAAAFVDRGADLYISWSETVSAAHTDAATDVLLQYLLLDELPASDAVARTMAELGPDPTYGSELLIYPSDG